METATPRVFISHSSKDKPMTMSLVSALRNSGVESWIDHEQIRLGDSIPLKISQGLADADAILVLISKNLVASNWCRAEYESLLTKEIESGHTYVIALRLDDTEMPILMRAKRYADLRFGPTKEVIDELCQALAEATSYSRFERLRPNVRTGFNHSVLGMIIAGVLKESPVSAFGREASLSREGMLELYRAVEALISRFQDLCDELLQALITGGVTAGDHQSVYGSARVLGKARIRAANRKLLNIAKDMREMGSNLQQLLPEGSEMKKRFGAVSNICAAISVAEDFLIVEFGAPTNLMVGVDSSKFPQMVEAPEPISSLDLHDAWDNSAKIDEYQRILEQLDRYKFDLREEIARLA